MKKQEPLIIVFKLTNGENIMGMLLGEQVNEFSGEHCISLHSPVKMIVVTNTHPEGGIVTHYVPQLYFPFGSPLILVPMKDIMYQDIASDFFKRMYFKILGEMKAQESQLQSKISEAFDLDDTKYAFESASPESFFIDNQSDVKH